jgi:hypothetical protein
MSPMVDYDEQITSILASRVGKEVARRYLQIKHIGSKIFVRSKDSLLDVGCEF